PTPWRVEKIALGECVIAANGDELALVYTNDGLDEPTQFPAVANAELIVRAVNSHVALVEALEYMLNCFDAESTDVFLTLDPVGAISKARAALSHAKARP
ncbi:MAG: hypothetical protein EB034_24985, partial [Verrucomicrobia bacterium]|nr:hypothetical protein [Verrucomicrobiota bacterium]